MRAQFALLICSASLTLTGCPKRSSPAVGGELRPAASAAPQGPATPVDACLMLTSEEIEAVQGETPKETKPAEKVDQGLAVSDCFVTLPTFSKSISLSVAQNGRTSNGVKQFWKENFTEPKHIPRSGPALKVASLGDDAYWIGDEHIGALYTLKGERYLRISVGGPGDQNAKIAKCRALAEKALPRL